MKKFSTIVLLMLVVIVIFITETNACIKVGGGSGLAIYLRSTNDGWISPAVATTNTD